MSHDAETIRVRPPKRERHERSALAPSVFAVMVQCRNRLRHAARQRGQPAYSGGMERAIVGYHQDEHGEWVAELACGHQRHVRHEPPFELRPWVVEAEGRRGRLGTPIDCGLCERSVSADAGGESACYAHALCPKCGAVLDGGPHHPGCAAP